MKMTTNKFNIGERVKINLNVKTYNPPVGYIIAVRLRFDKCNYKVRFDKPLFPESVIEPSYIMSAYEDRLIRIS